MAAGSKKVIYAALIGNTLIAITKFIAAFLTRSSAMFSEAIHSLVDTGNQGLLLYGLRRAQKPADEVESVARRLDRELKVALPRVKRVFFEAEAKP